MATIQVSVDTDRIIFREDIDRDGPMLSVLLSSKQALRQAINSLSNHGDEVIAEGIFSRTADKDRMPMAIFQIEQDAIDWVVLKGVGFVVNREIQVDGFNWTVTEVK